MTSEAPDPCAARRADRDRAEANVRDLRRLLTDVDVPSTATPTLERLLGVVLDSLARAERRLGECEAAHRAP